MGQEEKDAIIAGIKKHGLSKWTNILDENPGVLGRRTNVQIKVRDLKN